MSFFQKAEKRKAWLKIALTGPSGSGKTMSALKLAEGLRTKDSWRIGLIDTEARSASLYADKFEFFTAELNPPYTIQKYIEAIDHAANGHVDVLIIDSISHAWAGDGGLLSKKEAADARGGNSFANWAKITPEHEKFKAKLLNAQMHLICTMRSKQDYVLDANDKGKQAPRKVGLAPIQRDGMEYEFTTVFDIGMDHQATPSKDRTGLFDGQFFQIERATGELFSKWLNASSGELVVAPETPTEESKKFTHQTHSVSVGNHPAKTPEHKSVVGPISEKQENYLKDMIIQHGWDEETLRTLLLRETGQGATSKIPWNKFDTILKTVRRVKNEAL